MRETRRYAFKVDEGFTDLACSEYESTQANRVAMNEMLAAAVAAERTGEPVGYHIAQTMQQVKCRAESDKRATCETKL